ncbi:hypothetical protein WJX72_004784 [[Myrmecia] bisecta]|uniref:UspA domain-containing protein n=1 Tax=[Myrmecia] bisecta TaxID=41462 RepID=A0AAW1Q7R4_9CHLO
MSSGAQSTPDTTETSDKNVIVLAVDIHDQEEHSEAYLPSVLLPIVKQTHQEVIPIVVRPRHSRRSASVVGEAICKYAAYFNVYLVIMGNHIKHPMTEAIQGSVVKYCVQHCTQPLLLVRT